MEIRSSKLIIALSATTSPPIHFLCDVNIHSNFSISLHQALSMFIKPQFRICPIAEEGLCQPETQPLFDRI